MREPSRRLVHAHDVELVATVQSVESLVDGILDALELDTHPAARAAAHDDLIRAGNLRDGRAGAAF